MVPCLNKILPNNMEPWLNGIWPQAGLRPASELDSTMKFCR